LEIALLFDKPRFSAGVRAGAGGTAINKFRD
jgi:hypothetical protein